MSYDGVMALPPASWPGYPRSCPRAKADRIRPKRDTTADPVARHDAWTPMHSRNHLRVPRASACICVRHFLPLSTQTPAAPTQTPASRSTTASNFSRRYAADARKARRCSEPSRRRQPVPTPHGSMTASHHLRSFQTWHSHPSPRRCAAARVPSPSPVLPPRLPHHRIKSGGRLSVGCFLPTSVPAPSPCSIRPAGPAPTPSASRP